MNRLAAETSPYLRQHRDNPVDWYPWGEEAFEAAERLDRPIFLSVGYSACHWCHVMAHESFEDEAVGKALNDSFVAVKVDREERPDVDSVYLEAVQAMTGQGGWPMSVFCTPDGRPFFAGTYFPSDEARGRPTFLAVVRAVEDAWRFRRHELLQQADSLSGAVRARLRAPEAQPGAASSVAMRPAKVRALVESAVARLAEIHDGELGGFGRAPKFPQPPMLELLLRAHVAGIPGDALPMVELSLAAMASGGIWDHLGGGFSRYSVDREWLVPHFEKMLYDQAGLARVYLHAWQATGDPRWRRVLDETVAYVERDLRSPGGGVFSAEDADSEGEEGRFYLWTPAELRDVLGDASAAAAASYYGVTENGNFEGSNILRRPLGATLDRPPCIAEARERLLAARSERVRPGLDDKVITEWNAMWCSALAEAALATGEESWSKSAVETAEFLLAEARRADGRWLRSWQGGRAAHLAYAADYAWLVDCFVRLSELTGEARWLDEAVTVADALGELFADPESGTLYTTGADAEELIVRPRDIYDGVTPSAGSVAAVALCRLGALSGEDRFAHRASAILRGAGDLPAKAPTAFCHLLLAAELLSEGPVEVVVAGDRHDLVRTYAKRLAPLAVLAWGERTVSAIWEERRDGWAYVCRRGRCLAPAETTADLDTALDEALATSLGEP